MQHKASEKIIAMGPYLLFFTVRLILNKIAKNNPEHSIKVNIKGQL